MAKSDDILIEQVRSTIGRPRRQREVLRGLGLRRIGQVVRRPNTEHVRGAVRAVSHLVRVTDAEAASEEETGGSS